MVFSSLLEVVKDCDKFPYHKDPSSSDEIHNYLPFRFETRTISHVLPRVYNAIIEYNKNLSTSTPSPFEIHNSHISFASWVDTFEKRTQAMKELCDTWRKQDKFVALRGWRNELFPVYGDSSQKDNIVFIMERAATPLFGIPTFGVHLNGYIYQADGTLKMWISRRSFTKPTWPGLLDNLVAGGISYKHSTKDTIVKECQEEANIPSQIAQLAKSVGVISYYTYTDNGLQPEVQYLFDLQLPLDFVPKPEDGEVDSFYLWTINEILESILKGEWKPNSALVVIDFMVRHGLLSADDQKDYIEISQRIHRNLELPTPSK